MPGARPVAPRAARGPGAWAPVAQGPRTRARARPARWAPLLSLLLVAGCAAPGPFVLTHAGSCARAPFVAGVGSASFTPAAGYPLGGYGGGARRAELPFYAGLGWPGRIALWAHQAWHQDDPEGLSDMLAPSEGALEDIGARALVLVPAGAPPLALVRIDAIGVPSELHDLVLTRLADLGYRKDTLVLAATHTHSGPGAFFRAPLARLIALDNYRPELEARMADAIAQAVREAHARARPAELAFARARDRAPDGSTVLAKNRRARRFRGEIAYDAIDDEVELLLVRERGGGAPLGLLVNYAVHPTVFGADNLRYSRDVAGGVEEALARRVGAPALFFNAAEGDVGPRALKEQEGLPRCRELGEAFAALVAPALAGAAFHDQLELRSAAGEKELGAPRGVVALGRERFLDGEASWAAWPMELVTLPLNLVLWVGGLTDVRVVLTWNLGLGVIAHLDGLTPRTRTRVGGVRLRAGDEDVALLTVPGEATHDEGLAMRAEARRRGATRTFIIGLAQDHTGYLASRAEYRRGGYEAHSTLFGAGAAEQVRAAQRAVLDALGFADAPGR
ncbi:MAG: neutral/alkaline non-lysosomal ceramidase N-terminal domain-containing protein [Planctomycetota bacterium]